VRRFFWVFAVFLPLSLPGQTGSPSVESRSNYLNWGWDAVVLRNGLITVATVPAIGARIMQYDLGRHASIFVNESELGKTYTPGPSSSWPNFGGFKNWPAPQERWNWPPPPSIDFGPYEVRTVTETPDSVTIESVGQKERWLTPGLRFIRRTTVFKNSSRVRVSQTLVNEGGAAARWSVWDITQSIVHHSKKTDYENFWVYFPLDPDSRYGKSGVRFDQNSSAWKGEVSPGIFGVQFVPDGKKIFSDSYGINESWVCYADNLDGYVYAKVFPVFKDQEYPDQGAHVEVWVSNSPLYLEVEVVSPVVELAANGGQYTFTEDWYAARLQGPVLAVNSTGAVQEDLKIRNGKITGRFGVFHAGSARLSYLDGEGAELGYGKEWPVTPLETFVLDETDTVPAGTRLVQLMLYKSSSELPGILSAASIGSSGAAASLTQNFPNPFSAGTKLTAFLTEEGEAEVALFDMRGRKVQVLLSGRLQAGPHAVECDAEGLSSGIYIARLKAGGSVKTVKMVLAR
jgi:hypothetical protein